MMPELFCSLLVPVAPIYPEYTTAPFVVGVLSLLIDFLHPK